MILPITKFDRTLNRSQQLDDNFDYLSTYLNGNITVAAFSNSLRGALTFTGPAITITSTGTLTKPVVDVTSPAAPGVTLSLTATDTFVLSSDLTTPWVSLTEWVATGGTITTGQLLLTGRNDSARYGSFVTASLPTPAGSAITHDITLGRLVYYSGGWLTAASSWVASPIAITANMLTLAQPVRSAWRNSVRASGTTTATTANFVKNRTASPLLFNLAMGIRKSGALPDFELFFQTRITLKHGSTILREWDKRHSSNDAGTGRSAFVPLIYTDSTLAAGTYAFTVELTLPGAGTFATTVAISVTEL